MFFNMYNEKIGNYVKSSVYLKTLFFCDEFMLDIGIGNLIDINKKREKQ